MKSKILFSISFLLLVCINTANAQEKYFDPQPQNFLSQLKTLFKENGKEELMELYKKLEQDYKEQKISDKQQERMVDILNIMHFRKMQVYPYYRNFIEAANMAHQSGYDEVFLDRWYNYVKGVLKNAKVGQNKDFNLFIDFSNDLFSKNCLVADKSKNWMIDSKDLNFSYIDGKTYVKVINTNLKGFYDKDTLTIYNTSGIYSVNDKLWKGDKGKITWMRVGLPAEAIIGEYIIDMTKSEYEVDSARLIYPEYFGQAIYGKILDKITKHSDTEKINYPQFYSYGKSYSFNNAVASNVFCSGGFIIKGKKVNVGSRDGEIVRVEIKNGLGKQIFAAEGSLAIFEKGKYISMQESRIVLYAKNDSIFHPFCQFKYDVAKRELRVNQEYFGSGRSRFRSSYHKMSFETEMLTWNIDSTNILLQNLVGKGKNATKFVSDHNFDKNTYNLARTAAVDNDPLSLLSKLNEQYPEGVSVDDFAKKLGPAFSVSAVLPAIFMLEKEGFVTYKSVERKIMVNQDYAKFYIMANAKRKDYDIIRFNGYGVDKVGTYNTKTNVIKASNVAKIPFNDSSKVYAYPSDTSSVVINNDRIFDFSGKIFAGRMDIYGQNFNFNYDSFQLKSNQINVLKINIPGKKDPATGEDITQKPLASQLDSFKGILQINSRFNRSGKESARKYPILTTTSNAYVYYDHSHVFGGIYKREKFKFEVAPFKKDSLQYFEPDLLTFDGKLYSHDIFNVFPEKLSIQKDLSLGFTTQTPPTGLISYKNKGSFNGQVHLSNQGLIGKGVQKHQSLELTADSILYFPERAFLEAQNLEMKTQKTPIELPQISAKNTLVDWKPYQDTMILVAPKAHPFSMYDKATEMHGVLTLTNLGLYGKGYLDFPEAKIASNQMVFKSKVMTADTSSMEIKSIGNKVTFKTPNVNTKMDFERKIGEFKSNAADISTIFAENKYKAEINEFTWDMNKKILTFTSPPNSIGSRFTSIHPDQDSLFFFAKKAEYNMTSSIIKVDGAEEIRIADSRVMPFEGKLTILPDAKMQTLENAIIEGDTSNAWHVFDKCKLNIHGKNDMVGIANYTLKVNNKDHAISLTSIRVAKKEVGKDKKRMPIIASTIEGKGMVKQDQDFKLYRNVDFYGEVTVFMNQMFPHFSGQQRILFDVPSYKTPWFSVDNTINVESFQFINKNLATKDGDALVTGFIVDRSEDAPKGLYTSILNKLNNPQDQIALDCRGVVSHHAEKNVYVFGDSSKIIANQKQGNKIEYKDSSGIIKAEGLFDPKLKMGGIPVVLGGTIDNNMVEQKYDFNVTAAMKIQLEPRVLNVLANTIFVEFEDSKDISYDKSQTKKQLEQILFPQEIKKIEEDVAKSGLAMSAPKISPYNLYLTNLALEWDKDDLCYRSRGAFGLASMGGVMINKEVVGYLEMGYGEYQDFFNLYFKAKNREWFYITYSDGVLGLVSSNENFNNMLSAVDPKKRYVRKNEKEFYKFMPAGNYEADQFYKRMRNGGKFATEDKSKYFGFEKPDYSEKDLKEAEKFEESTPELEAIKRENAIQDSLIEAMEKKIADEEKLREQERLDSKKSLRERMEESLKKAQESEIEDIVKDEPVNEAPKEATPVENVPKEAEPAEEAPTNPEEEKSKEDEEKEPTPDSEKEEGERNQESTPPAKKEIPEDLFNKYF